MNVLARDWALARAQALKHLKRFDPSQPRDEHGRWMDAGGSDDAGGGGAHYDVDKVEAKTKLNVSRASEQARKRGETPMPGSKGEHPATIASRNPTALKTTATPKGHYGQPDTATMKLDPKRYEKDISKFENDDFYPNFRKSDLSGSTDDAVNNVVAQMKDNIKFLYQYADKSTQVWYDGARALVDDRVKLWGFNDASVAGVYAALSPTKDWDQNVHIADMLLKTYKNEQGTRWSAEMEEKSKTLWSAKNQKVVDLVRGKTLGELTTPAQKGLWIRTFDETHNEAEYRTVLPNGAMGPVVKNKDGTPSKVVWQSLPSITNAINALEANGDRDKISDAMGTAHKVRSFYNNILDPHSENGDVTIDTHAVGAALLRQLPSSAVPVAHNFGNTPMKVDQPEGWAAVGASEKTGLSGLYPVYAQAYREAAKELGIQPRQLQSAVWVVKRNSFGDLSKKDQEAVEALWHEYHDNAKVTLDQTRQAVAGILGLGKHERRSYRADERGRRRGDAGELHRDGVDIAVAGMDGRAGARVAGRAAGLDAVRRAQRRAGAEGLIARTAQNDWMDECVPLLMSYGKDQIVAVAACMRMWRDDWEEDHPDGADDPGPSPKEADPESPLADTKAYNEAEHPRDEHGRWTDGGGSDDAPASAARAVPLANQRKYFNSIESAPTNEGIEAAEENWRGGVADFGDPQAALDIQNMEGYFDYRSHLEGAAREHLGEEFPVFRLMRREQLEDWKNGADLDPVGATLDPEFAKKFQNFAGFDKDKAGDNVLVRIPATPASIVMRGSQEESEIVINPNEISGDTVEVVEKDSHPGKGYSKEARLIDGVIHTSNVNDAARALHEDRKVELNQPRQVSVLLDRLGEISKGMIEKGEDAPKFNLCNVTVRGTSLFCASNLGIERIEMPQFYGDENVKFAQHLIDSGYKLTHEEQFASHLRATQNQLDGVKVADIANYLRDKPDHQSKQPIFVSNDDYILDGHHRWAAKIGLDAADNILGNTAKMNIARVDIDIVRLLEEAKKFGAGRAGFGDFRPWDDTKPRGLEGLLFALETLQRVFNEAEHPRDEHGRWTDGGGSDDAPAPTPARDPWKATASAKGIKGLPKDIVIKDHLLGQAQERGAFEMAVTETKPGTGGQRERYTIGITAKIPPGIEPFVNRPGKDESRADRVWYYDPKLAELHTVNKGEQYLERTYARPREGLSTEIEELPGDDIIYRGMRAEEYEKFMQTGEITSTGFYNMEGQEGLTYWATDAATAASYANGFAPWPHKATFERPAYVVATRMPKETRHVEGVGENEVGVARAITKDEIVGVWRGDVFQHSPGDQDIRPTSYDQNESAYEAGSGSGVSSDVVWQKVEREELGHTADQVADAMAAGLKTVTQLNAYSTAVKLDFNPALIEYTDEDRDFKVGEQSFKYAGSYTRGSSKIKLYMKQLSAESVKGITAHEIGHRKFELLRDAYAADSKAMFADPGPPPDPDHKYWWGRRGGSHAMMTPDGELRPPYDAKYPIYHEWNVIQNMRPSLEQDDGITDYSKMYWKEWEKGDMPTDKAYHETMAEIEYMQAKMGKHSANTGAGWRRLYDLQKKVWAATDKATRDTDRSLPVKAIFIIDGIRWEVR